jgi:general secretion pathway protein H
LIRTLVRKTDKISERKSCHPEHSEGSPERKSCHPERSEGSRSDYRPPQSKILRFTQDDRAAPAGFTLIEILVVLFIISIMSGIAVANLPGFTQTREFDTEVRRLKTLLDMAREESIVQATEFGFAQTKEGYGFYTYDERSQSWKEYVESPFQPRKLPESIELELKVEKQKLTLATQKKETTPSLLLLSSGEVTPFTLTILQGDDLERSMRSDGYGDIEWLDDEKR